MCDRPLPQQALCADLADLITVLPDQNVVKAWLRGFWATMAREWTTGIDVLRMEKFLLLVRRVVGASFVWMKAAEKKTAKKGTRSKRGADGEAKEDAAPPRWDEERVEVVVSLLADWPLRLDEETKVEEGEEHGDLLPKFVPAGLKLHVLDIWVDEAEKAGLLADIEDEADEKKTKTSSKKQDASSVSGTEVLTRIHALVENLRAETRSTAVRIRATESLADERLPWSQKDEDEEDEEEEEVWRGLD